jgi:exonuclease III
MGGRGSLFCVVVFLLSLGLEIMDFNLSIFTWNVNGLASNRFDQFYVCLEEHKFPHIVCLQETHCNNPKIINHWKSELKQYQCFFSLGNGYRNGTAVFIHKSLNFRLNLEIEDIPEGRFTVIKGQLLGELVSIVSAYSPCYDNDKPSFYEKLIMTNLEGIKIVMGDFNSSPRADIDRARLDKNKSETHRRDGALIEFIENQDLIDTWRFCHPGERDYTYSNISRIDLILVSGHFHKEIMNSEIGCPFFSDHRIVMSLLSWGEKNWGQDFKKIRPATIANPDFEQVFHAIWTKQEDNFLKQFQEKLRHRETVGDIQEFFEACSNKFDYKHPFFIENLTLDGKWWDSFKNELHQEALKFQRFSLHKRQQEFHELQKFCLERPAGSETRNNQEQKLKQLLLDLSKEFIFQKSKDKRLNFERPTAGFFRMVAEDRKNQRFDTLQVNGNTTLTNKEDIQEHLIDRYEQLYAFSPMGTKYKEYFFNFMPKLEKEESTDAFSYKEIYDKFKSRPGSSCPGPDGIPVEFYKKFFPIFGPYYINMLNNCVLSSVFPESWFLSYLKVIPKTQDKIPTFDKLRPLNLSNDDYKNTTGCLTDRMTAVSQDIIHPQQTGGLPHRSIQQSTFLIHLLINLFKETDQGGYIVALDNTKAFDKVNRLFLFTVLEKAGFKPWTIKLIKTIYSGTKVRLLINGFLSKIFEIYSGVKQGCPLSPFLYVLTVEALARAILLDRELYNLGFRLPSQREVKLIQHLDDMTFFAKDKCAVEKIMSRIYAYQHLSGSQVNFGKSNIIRLDRQRLSLARDGPTIAKISVVPSDECIKILGFLFGSDIEMYMKANWEKAKEKCLKTLKMWSTVIDEHNSIISLVGRALIVNVKIYSQLTYLFQTLQYNRTILKEITSEISRFLWAGKPAQRTMEVLESPKELGGLGLKPLALVARSARFRNIQQFFSREGNWMENGPIQTFILAYILDCSIRKLVTNTPFSELHPHMLPLRYFTPKSSRYPKEIPGLFDVMYWDIAKALEISDGPDNFIFQTAKGYLQDLMNNSTLSLRASGEIKIYIRKFGLPEKAEAKAWENILLQILDPKIQSFAYLLAHDGLPTAHRIWKHKRKTWNCVVTPWCKYCQYESQPFMFHKADARHIFSTCPIAINTWDFINTKLENAGLPGIEVNDGLIYMRLGLSKSRAFFVSEVLWSLWKIATHNYHNITGNIQGNVGRDYTHALASFVGRMKLLSKMDKDLIKSKKTYSTRWNTVNEMVNCVADT